MAAAGFLGADRRAVFFAKVGIGIFFMWVRSTLPRFRYDQANAARLLFFFEIALVNIYSSPPFSLCPTEAAQDGIKCSRIALVTSFVAAYPGVFRGQYLIMAITVPRPKLNWRERLYLPAIVAVWPSRLSISRTCSSAAPRSRCNTPRKNGTATCRTIIAARPPSSAMTDGRVRCVACQLCEFICPPRAIKIVPGEIPSADRFAKVEKYPEEFDIDMIRCIYCGMCEEVCPEQAIFLRKDYAITGFTREEMVHHKEKLLEIGGVMHGVVLKWNEKK